MTALTSGSILSSFVCTLDRELCPGESPNSFPLHSPGLRSCFSHLMLLCSGRGRAGEESGSIAVRHAIKCNSEVTESDVSQCLLWQRKGGRAGLLFEGTENSSGNLGVAFSARLQFGARASHWTTGRCRAKLAKGAPPHTIESRDPVAAEFHCSQGPFPKQRS